MVGGVRVCVFGRRFHFGDNYAFYRCRAKCGVLQYGALLHTGLRETAEKGCTLKGLAFATKRTRRCTQSMQFKIAFCNTTLYTRGPREQLFNTSAHKRGLFHTTKPLLPHFMSVDTQKGKFILIEVTYKKFSGFFE